MLRVVRRLSWSIAFGLLLAASCFAQSGLRVNEAAARIKIHTYGSVVLLPIENPTRKTIASHVLIELIAPSGVVQIHGDRDVSLRPGSTQLKIALPPAFAQNEKVNWRNLLWYRLRYTITASAPDKSLPAPLVGILSVGEATPECFELHVAGPESVREGGHYTARVRAIHPVTGRPVAGVLVQASLDLDADDDKPLVTPPSVTDSMGFATLAFTLPDSVDTDQIDVKVTGKLGDISADADGDFNVDHFSSTAVSTDKPIYQPGQMLHARLMAFGPNKKAISGQSVTLKILDPDETLVYRTDTRTSKFGIASADWQIPDNLRLGTYQIQADFGEGRYEDSGAEAAVRISRYELPSFTVTATPDRRYYLPDQNASVEIHADYLFGQPVRRGHVRLVQESDRKWNYSEQKWDVTEGATYEGDTDGQGRYVAKVDLTKDQEDLEGNDYERFQDLNFAAYFTDSSTGRTEQRRFDLRITKDPIHIYVIAGGGSEVSGLPLEFYVSTDYADGTPAPCDVEINWVIGSESSRDSEGPAPTEELLRRVRTNRYGLAKIRGLKVPSEPDTRGFDLSFRARDSKGEIGRHVETMWYSRSSGIRVHTDKMLYQPGDPIDVQLESTRPDATVVVEAVHDFQVLASKLVRVRHGRAEVSFDATEPYHNDVTILAYGFGLTPGDSNENEESGLVGSHTVLFPKDNDLKVDVKLGKPVYRPGEEAAAALQVTRADGRKQESAIGLVVVDQAVEERARTDQDFGGQDSFFDFRDERGGNSQVGGIRISDLNKIDLTKPLPDGLELVAEILLQFDTASPETFDSDANSPDLRKLFAPEIDPQMKVIRAALDARYEETGEYPKTQVALDTELAAAGQSLQDMKDPWGTPYRAEFSVDREWDVLEIKSAGPDKVFGTDDDFVVVKMTWAYFKPVTQAMSRAVKEFHDRTGGFIRDAQTLTTELTRLGVDFDSLRDPWGHAYQLSFGVDRTQFSVTVTSAGPDGRFDSKAAPSDDDFTLATVDIDYFASTKAQLEAALTDYFRQTQVFPENLDQLREALESSGIHWDTLRDAWNHPYYATFRQEVRYSDDLSVESYGQYANKNLQHTTAVPVTQTINWIIIRSAGEDGVVGTSDDFDVAAFSRGVLAQSANEKMPVPAKGQAVLEGSGGAISGTVVDITGAVISGAEISAKKTTTGDIFTAKTGDDGAYVLRNLPAGFYEVMFSARGFQSHTITDVPVHSSEITHLNGTLNVGSVTETVTVSAEAVKLQTESAAISVSHSPPPPPPPPPQLSTPRLREYFPETLLWRPEVVTDDKGRAQVTFPLADNITTWQMAAVASTVDGDIGTAEKDIRAFQPFFVDLDPPRFLTAGDEIALPVVLRNYLDRPLQLSVAMKPSPWFSALSPTTMKTNVSPGDSANDVFRFRAETPIKEGKDEVSAIGADASDAISRSITVRPNGEEMTESASQVFDAAASLDLKVPDTAITGSVETTLKIYPNLTAHILESIEAILERPYGCAEQAISSTYPSVLLLKYAKEAGVEDSALLPRAHRYTELGYERLLSYRTASGGFSYWGKGDADIALTVYAIKFLSDARDFVAVDDSVIEDAETWVLSQAQPDGHWVAPYWTGKEDSQRNMMLTAYIARMIATSALPPLAPGGNTQSAKSASAALHHALAYLRPQVESVDEPYVIASYALAALGAGDSAAFTSSVARLRALEHREGDSGYWSLEMNTPFYGWGIAGRVETTALVLQVLASSANTTDSQDLISRGLLFLLRNQDRYGIWYSTQATINVLDAMASLIARNNDLASRSGKRAVDGPNAAVYVDGKQALSITLPPAGALTGPVDVDISKFVSPGKHHIDIRRPSGSSRASIQLLADYYVPWTYPAVDTDLHHEAGASDALRLSVRYDKQSANVGDTVECSVDAERIGFRGYGMLLAEIGLPPGAEVDRSSLEKAVAAAGWDVDEYDVLPDRVVVYLWPHAGGTKFSFTFKPRFALKALTTPSILYDYYNPEAQAVVAPVPFIVN
jgi:hypothetical protein